MQSTLEIIYRNGAVDTVQLYAHTCGSVHPRAQYHRIEEIPEFVSVKADGVVLFLSIEQAAALFRSLGEEFARAGIDPDAVLANGSEAVAPAHEAVATT